MSATDGPEPFSDEWIAEVVEKRNQCAARDCGLTIEEARSEYQDPASFRPTAAAFVAEAEAKPGWWDRRRNETPEQHGQRLKRLHFCQDIVSGRHVDYGRSRHAPKEPT